MKFTNAQIKALQALGFKASPKGQRMVYTAPDGTYQQYVRPLKDGQFIYGLKEREVNEWTGELKGWSYWNEDYMWSWQSTYIECRCDRNVYSL